MLKKTVCAIICIMFTLVLSNVVSAQIKPSTFSVTPYIGGYLFDRDQKLGNAPVYGIGLGYNFTKYWGVEASGDFVSTNYDLTVSGSQSTSVGNYRFDGIFNLLPDSRLVPFVFAGFGGQSINYPNNVPNRIASAIDYGAGLKYFFTDWLALRGDVRESYIFDGSRKDIAYTLGLTFYFGGPKPATASRREPVAEPMVGLAANEKVEAKAVAEASEAKPEEKVVAAVAEPKVVNITLEDVHFDFDQSTLTPEVRASLKKDIRRLKESPDTTIRIAGYTSASGTKAYNQKLSERRANAVRDYLVGEGAIAPDRISAIGYGKEHPAVTETAPKDLNSAAAKANMRAIFEITVK